MKITEFDWNSFWVILNKQSNEDKKAYFEKAKKCLTQFYEKYTSINPPSNLFWWMKEEDLECLTKENNFSDMYLEVDCDVKFRVRPDGIKEIPSGIWVYSHRIENRRSQVEFLIKKWKEFEYN